MKFFLTISENKDYLLRSSIADVFKKQICDMNKITQFLNLIFNK